MQGELKTFETVLLKCDRPYLSGRVYPKEVVEKAIENFNKEFETLWLETTASADSDSVDMLEVAGAVHNLHLVGDEVKGTVSLLDTPNGRLLQNIELEVGLVGIGDINYETNKVTDYTITKAIAGGKK